MPDFEKEGNFLKMIKWTGKMEILKKAGNFNNFPAKKDKTNISARKIEKIKDFRR